MKKMFFIFTIAAAVIVVADAKPKPKPPPGCGYDSNGTKVCCAQVGQAGICWAEDWTPVQDPQ